MQDRYFQTLDELKQDLGEFKSKIENENKFIKEEFLGQRGNSRTLQMQSSRDEASNPESRRAEQIEDRAEQQSADFRPPHYPVNVSERQKNARMSPADYNATLPNNYRQVQAQFERGHGASGQSNQPARSNRTDQMVGPASGLPVDSQSASYTGSGTGMVHEDGRTKYQLDGQSRSQYSQNYDHDMQRSEE